MTTEKKEKKLREKLFELQGLTMSKNADNPFFKSKYLSLEKLLAELNPILKKHQLVVFHTMRLGGVVTSLVDVEGEEFIESTFPIQEGIEPQKVGSAITYAKRYNLGMIFNIITDEDDDGNVASMEKKAENRPQTAGQTINQPTDSDLVCSVCGTQGKVSYKKDPNGRPYCPNWKEHNAKGEKFEMVSPTEELPNVQVDEFFDNMPDEK